MSKYNEQVKTSLSSSDLLDIENLADVFHVSRSAIMRACIIYALNNKRQDFIRFLDRNVSLYK